MKGVSQILIDTDIFIEHCDTSKSLQVNEQKSSRTTWFVCFSILVHCCVLYGLYTTNAERAISNASNKHPQTLKSFIYNPNQPKTKNAEKTYIEPSIPIESPPSRLETDIIEQGNSPVKDAKKITVAPPSKVNSSIKSAVMEDSTSPLLSSAPTKQATAGKMLVNTSSLKSTSLSSSHQAIATTRQALSTINQEKFNSMMNEQTRRYTQNKRFPEINTNVSVNTLEVLKPLKPKTVDCSSKTASTLAFVSQFTGGNLRCNQLHDFQQYIDKREHK